MNTVWSAFCRHRLGMAALIVIVVMGLAGVYAPFLASSQPLAVKYEGHWYFPLFRYLFFRGYYTKGIDIFFNLLMFTLPLLVAVGWWFKGRLRSGVVVALVLVQLVGSVVLLLGPVRSPVRHTKASTWAAELASTNGYGRLEMVLGDRIPARHHARLAAHYPNPPTPWSRVQHTLQVKTGTLRERADATATRQLDYLQQKEGWLKQQHLRYLVMPLLKEVHWEEDAGGSREFNGRVRWFERTRVNRKDLASSLLYGVRVSLMVGIAAVALSMLIGIPLGAVAGYYGGRIDIWLSRFTEVWESMPTFFMLLMIVAILQQRSIFLIVLILGCFGWTTYARYFRAEVLKQRGLAYVEAGRCQGLPDRRILFGHIFPNAIPPILTLLPFSIMNAITREAGLAFLGLGEEGSASWGVLMDEGRSVFPGESYLLWPPAIALTILLVAIALVGDALRDALDPKLR